jgi:hypothetical protein
MKLSVATAFFTFMAVMREIAALPDCNTYCSTTELSVATGTAFVMSSLGFTPVLKARRWEPALSISAWSAPVQSWAEPAWTPSPVSQPYWTQPRHLHHPSLSPQRPSSGRRPQRPPPTYGRRRPRTSRAPAATQSLRRSLMGSLFWVV